MFIVVQFCELLLDPMNGAVNTTDTLEGTVAGYSAVRSALNASKAICHFSPIVTLHFPSVVFH